VLAAGVGPITKQTVLQNITGLVLPISASATERWRVTYFLFVEAANNAMDLKLGFTAPAGASGRWGAYSAAGALTGGWAPTVVGTTPAPILPLGTALEFGTRAGVIGIPVTAVIKGGGTAGNLQIQYAQNTEDAGALSILDGSVLEAVKVAA